jgi:glycosyltransferase involved in cell wall biosynthesis
MKICFLGLYNLPVLAREYNSNHIGGEEVQQTLLARALVRRGHQVSMVCLDYGQTDGAQWHGVTVYKAYVPTAGVRVLRFIHPRWTGIWSALGRANADIYYTSCAGMHVGLLAAFCGRRKKGQVFRLASNQDVDPALPGIQFKRDKVLYRYGLKKAHAVLSQHRFQQELLMRNFGVRSEVADMLVDPPERELPLAARDVHVLWVNNFRDLKRPDLAIDLASRMPDVRMHMVGGVLPGFERLYQAIQARAQAQHNLCFHGRTPYHDVGDLYDRARVFVNTSDIEGFPNSYLQSWRRGVPVVAFFDPDGLIQREKLGFIVQSMQEMVDCVRLLLTDDATWYAHSERCRNYMATRHADDVVLAPYLEAFAKADAARGGQ